MNKTKTSKILMLILVVNLFLIQFALLYQPTKAYPVSTSETFFANVDTVLYKMDASYTTAHDSISASIVYYTWDLIVGQNITSPSGSYPTIFRVPIFFDTSILPTDATINSAYLSIYITSDNTTERDFNVSLTHDGTHPYYPSPSIWDYYYNYYGATVGGTNDTAVMPAIGNWWNITLNSDGLAWISIGGITNFYIRSSLDINSTAPLDQQYITFASHIKGEAYAPRLYVNFTREQNVVLIHGPYNEDGTVYDGITNVTLNFPNHDTQYNFLNGSDGSIDDLTIATDYPMESIFWNISSTYDYERVYFLDTSTTYNEVWLYVPNMETSTVNRYAISINAFGTLTNTYAETLLNINGSNRVLERVLFDPVNAMDFWLTQFHQYTFRIVSDEGTFSWTLQADATTSKSYIITADMIQRDYTALVNITATRVNSTYISVYFTDVNQTTIWVNVAFLVKSGTSYHEEYSLNDTTYSTTVNWYEAQPTKDYMVNVTYLRGSTVEHWQELVGVLGNSTSYWTILTDLIPDAPFPIDQLPGLAIVLLIASIASYADSEEGMGIAVIAAAILTYIGWLQIPVTALALASVFVAFTLIHKGKQKERNEA